MQSKILKKKIKVEVAKTPLERTTGLMYRRDIGPDSGMLFLFDRKQPLSFWGMNTYMPLDIAFIDSDKIVDIKKIVPLSTKAVKCEAPCNRALEVKSNFFVSHGIKVGSSVLIDENEISFFE